jgi:hypothetical protein
MSKYEAKMTERQQGEQAVHASQHTRHQAFELHSSFVIGPSSLQGRIAGA